MPKGFHELRRLLDVIKSAEKKDLVKLVILSDYLIYKTYSKIIYGLQNLKLSSYWELHNLLNLPNMTQIRRCISVLEAEGIISEMKEDTEEHKIAARFWKNHYPNSPYTPTFFILNQQWKDPVICYETHLSRFFTAHDMAKLRTRTKKYDNYREIVISQNRQSAERRKTAIGECSDCGILITKEAQEIKDYYRYGNTIICKRCHMKATTDRIRKWTKQKS